MSEPIAFPSPVARTLSGVVVALAVLGLTRRLGTDGRGQVTAVVLAQLAHGLLDEPLSRRVSALGL